MRTLKCRRCKKKFETEGEWRKHCPECRKAVKKEKDRKWYMSERGKEARRRSMERRKALREKELYEELPEGTVIDEIMETDPKDHYCAGYDATRMTCINCYADTTAQYRGCYKKIGAKK